jgi:hypothetical protein
MMNNSSTDGKPTAEKIAPYVLLGMTAATGLVDAVSFLSLGSVLQAFVLIAFMGLAMGTRNAAVRKLAIPDLTTTVLTLTVTGIAADSSLAKGDNPRLARRVGSVFAIFFGAAFGAVVIRHSISAALALATISVACSAALFRSLRTSDSL